MTSSYTNYLTRRELALVVEQCDALVKSAYDSSDDDKPSPTVSVAFYARVKQDCIAALYKRGT